MSRKEETEILKELLRTLSEDPQKSEKSRRGFKGMLKTVEAAEEDGVYLSIDILINYGRVLAGHKKTQDDDIDTVYI